MKNKHSLFNEIVYNLYGYYNRKSMYYFFTYVVVEKGKENKGKLWYNHDASIGAAAVGKKGTSRDKVTMNSIKKSSQ